ncbi:hypothetical protein [Chryseobacterium sp. AG844]|uniref:hypothetical protein n=1 Tax=Chryseobacterium sp. AG844 TaxID=2183998 RepID=UPI000D70D58C|nr:hypothetical protein [Chryseobacterium sp. AG844]
MSQNGKVGVNTSTPTATLDIAGDARIRTIDSISTPPKYIVTSDENGVLQKVNINKLMGSNPDIIRKKTFAILSKNVPQLLASKGTDYNVIYDGSVTGINTDKLHLNNNKDRIYLPPNKAFKITGYIGVRGSTTSTSANTPGYVTSLFSTGGDAKPLVTTQGYTESSTEGFDDGGVTPPIVIVTTGPAGNGYVELKVRYGGISSGDAGYYVSGAPSRNSVGTYILVEEV